MGSKNLLFNLEGRAITSDEIREKIAKFSFGYKEATQEIIQNSKVLDKDGEVFVRCTARILSSFGMTRSGPFKGVKMAENGNVKGKQILLMCWNQIGDDLIEIRKSVSNNVYSRDRYLLEDRARSDYLAKLSAMSGTAIEDDTGKAGPESVGMPDKVTATPPSGEAPGGAPPSGGPSSDGPSGGGAPGGAPSGGPPDGGPPGGGAPGGGAPGGAPPGGAAPSGGPPGGGAPSGDAPPSDGAPGGVSPGDATPSVPPGGEAPSGPPGGAAPDGTPPKAAGGKSSLQSEMLQEMERLKALMGGD